MTNRLQTDFDRDVMSLLLQSDSQARSEAVEFRRKARNASADGDHRMAKRLNLLAAIAEYKAGV